MLPLEDNPGTVPQEAIDETAPVAAARAHLGNSVRDRPLERYLAEPNNPANAAAIAKGISQFEESVYRQ